MRREGGFMLRVTVGLMVFFLGIFGSGILGPLRTSVSLGSDDYPTKPITLVIPYGKGGGSDRTYHAIKPGLDKHIGQETVIERVGGEGGTVGASFASKMPADGYHIFLSPAGPVVIQPHLRDLDYDYDNFEPICRLTQAPVAFMVDGDSKYNSLQEVIDDAKANPDKLAYASSGFGTVPHIVMETFNLLTETKMQHIPQSGGSKKVVQVVKDGNAQIFADPMTMAAVFGLKVLAVFSDERVPEFPEAPTLKELGIDMTYSLWFGLYAPKGTPQEFLDKLDCACAKALHEPEVIAQMTKEKNTIKYLGGEDLKSFVQAEYLKNKQFVEDAGLTSSVK